MKGTLFRLAIFASVCLFFTFFLAFTIGNVDYRDPLDRNAYTVRATFDDVTGLIANDNVKIAGIVVGKVTDIRLVDGRARVTMRIKNKYKVPVDTEASVRWRNLLGQRFVYLYPGTAPTVMRSGAVIAKTRSVVDLGDLFNRLGPIVRAIDPQQVNTFLDSFVAALDGNEGAVRSAVADLGKVAEAISQRDEAIGRILDNLSVLSDAIVNRDAQIRTTLDNLVKLGGTFGDNTKILDSAITNLSSISTDLAAFLQANRTQVDSIIANLLVVVKTVEGKLPDIGPTLNMLDDAALRLFTSSRYGEWLNQVIPCGRVITQDVSCDAAKTIDGVPLAPNLDQVLGPVTGPLLSGILPRVPVTQASAPAPGEVRVGSATPGHITRGSEAIAQLLGVPLTPREGRIVKSFRDWNPFVVGLIGVLLIGGMVGAAFIPKLLKQTYPASAVFSDGSGIKAGDDVKMAGVKIGLVSGILPDRRNGNVRVTMRLDDGVKLGADSHAEIALETLLGTKFVRFSGPVRAPYLRDVPAKDRVIPIQRTKVPFDVFETFKVGTKNIQATDTEKLNTLIRSLADITDGNKDDIARLLKGVTDLSTTLNSREAQLKELLDRVQQLTGVLADKDQTLVALVDQSKRILDLLSSRRDDIAALLRNGNSLVAEIARLLDVNRAQLDAILHGLHPTLETVKANQFEIDKFLSVAGPGAKGLALSSSHGPWQDIYVQAVGPDLITLLSGLSKP